MYLFIINPNSGSGAATSFWNKTERELIQQKVLYKSLISNSEVEARKFIAENVELNNITAIGVLGGDGTTSSVIQEIKGTNIPVAILPTGSGNDISRTFKLSRNPSLFVKGLLFHQTIKIDLLEVNKRFGITIVGVGIDATIGERVNNAFYKSILNKLGLGSFAYIIATILTFLSYKPFKENVIIDEKNYEMEKAWLSAIGNTASYGGGLFVCPTASPTDGLLNITLLHGVNRMTVLLRLFPALLRGQPVFHKGVTYKTGKKVVIQTNRPISVVLDGEIINSTPIEINIHAKSLNLILTKSN